MGSNTSQKNVFKSFFFSIIRFKFNENMVQALVPASRIALNLMDNIYEQRTNRVFLSALKVGLFLVLFKKHLLMCVLQTSCPEMFRKFSWRYWTGIYLFKFKNRNTWKLCEICSKLTIKTPEDITDVVLMSLLLTLIRFHLFFRCFHWVTLNRQMLAWYPWWMPCKFTLLSFSITHISLGIF